MVWRFPPGCLSDAALETHLVPCPGDARAACGQSTWPGSEASCQWPVRKPFSSRNSAFWCLSPQLKSLPEISGETLNWNQLRAALGFLTHILCERIELL